MATSTRDLVPADLPKGGYWKICYCANYDLTDGGAPCTAAEDYTVDAGLLTVYGPYGDGAYNCVRDAALCPLVVGGVHFAGSMSATADLNDFVQVRDCARDSSGCRNRKHAAMMRHFWMRRRMSGPVL